jgi:hypothetical protein
MPALRFVAIIASSIAAYGRVNPSARLLGVALDGT